MRKSGYGLFVVWMLLGAGTAQASLQSKLQRLLDPSNIRVETRDHEAHFTSSSASILGLFVQQVASEAGDFPAVSTTPGFTFRYDPDLKVFERAAGSLGSVFVDRGDTLGAGRFDVGLSYLYLDLNQLEGHDLEGMTLRLSHLDETDPTDPGALDPGRKSFENDTIDVTLRKFAIRSHVFSFFATYGLTDRWDVNVLLPVVFTTLDVAGEAHINNTTTPPVHFFDAQTNTVNKDLGSIDADRTGVGDLLLRTKYRLTQDSSTPVAGGLTFRLPTGSQDDFQGFGDATITPFLAGNHPFGPHDVHASFGIELDVEDHSRSRARYSVGATVQIIERLALVVDLLGNSGLSNQDVSRSVPVFNPVFTQEHKIGNEVVDEKIRTDLVDVAFGLKSNPIGGAVVYAAAIVPVTSDGLRADVIPSVGFQWGF